MTAINSVGKIPIFSGLDKSVLQQLLSRMEIGSYRKDDKIFTDNELGDTFFVITNGSVKITRIRQDGSGVMLSILHEGEFFGEISLFGKALRPATAIALDDTNVLMLEGKDFLASVQKHPTIALSLLTAMAKRTIRSEERIEILSRIKAKDRVGGTLLKLAEERSLITEGTVMVEKLPDTYDIAEMAGTSRETVSRVMASLAKKGLIRREWGRLLILDYAQFRRIFN